MLSGIFRSTIWNQTIPDRLRGRLAGSSRCRTRPARCSATSRPASSPSLTSVRMSIVSGGVLCVVGVPVVRSCCPASGATTPARPTPRLTAWRSARAAARRTRTEFRCAASAARRLHRSPRRTRSARSSRSSSATSKARRASASRSTPESLREVMARYFDVMRAAIERHGGTIEKFIGDAVMAVSACRACTRTTPCGRCAPRRDAGRARELNAELDAPTASRWRTGSASTPARSSRATRPRASDSSPATRSTSPRGSSRPPRHRGPDRRADLPAGRATSSRSRRSSR